MSRPNSFEKHRWEIFVVTAPMPGQTGVDKIYVSKVVFERDSAKTIAANHYGVTEKQLSDWLAERCGVQCQAKTKRGRRCLCYATGLMAVTPSEWVSIGPRYCALHEDGR